MERESRCKLYVVVKERDQKSCYINLHEDRFQHTCLERLPIEQKIRSHALMSKNVTSHLNVHHIMKDHKYKINKSVIQNEMAPRNSLDQRMKLGERSDLRAVKKVQQLVLGNHKKDVIKLESAVARISKTGYGVELIWSDILVQKTYEGFLYRHLPSMK